MGVFLCLGAEDGQDELLHLLDHAAADHDDLRVDDIDERGDGGPDPSGRLADDALDVGVAAGDGLAEVVALDFLQVGAGEFGEKGGLTLGDIPADPRGDGGSSGHGFE